jgi:CSLREA domain-containing protein
MPKRSVMFLIALLLGAACAWSTPALADTAYTVTTTADPGDGTCDAVGTGDGCTLREAISAANSNADASIITFAAGVSGTINLTGVLPDLSHDLEIQGPGAKVLTVRRDSGGDYRIFKVNSGVTITINGLTISNGKLNGTLNQGGGILNWGALTLTNSTVSGNSASGGNTNQGGGIYNNDDTPNIGNSIVAGNTAASSPDIYGTITSQGHNLIGDTSDTTVTGDTTGNILNTDAKLGALQDNGGPTFTMLPAADSPAIDAGNTDLTEDQRGVHRPYGSADDIGAVERSFADGPNFVVTVAEDSDDGDYAANDISLREAIKFANANADASVVTFASNVTGTITLGSALPDLDSDIEIQGPGASTLAVSGDNKVRVFNITSGHTVTISGLTITQGKVAGGSGGGIRNSGTLTISDSTLSGNSAGGDGGGIYTSIGGLTVTSSTLSGNSATGEGGGIANSGTLRLANSIVAGNTAGDDANISGDIDTNTNNITSGDPRLGALQDNGGPTFTMLPAADSPAIDAGDTDLTTDQRGVLRPQGSADDIGAVEREADATAPESVTITTPSNGASVSSLSTLSGSASDNAGGSGIRSVSVVLHRYVSGGTQYWNGSEWVTTPAYLYPTLESPGAVDTNWSLASNKIPSGTNLPVGTYYLRAWAYDQGKLSVYSGLQSFKVKDTTAPESVSITNPANGSTVSSLSSIDGSAEDNAGGSGIKSVSVVLHRLVSGSGQYWNGSAWTATPSYLYPTLSDPGAVDTNWGLAVDKLPSGTNLPAGTYYLRAWAYDQGNRSVYSGLQSFKAGADDATAPESVTITTPANGVSVNSLAAISGSASDNAGGSGIKSVSVVLHRIVDGATQYWNGSAWVATASYLYPTLGAPDEASTDWSLAADMLPVGANLPAGTYYLRAWAYDQGNRSVSSGLQSFSVGASGLSATPSSVKLQDVSGIVSSSRIVLTFDSGLQPATANDASNYAVTVGGVRASILSASYAPSTHRVTLQLKDGALRGDGEIVVGHRNLRDVDGNVLEQAAYVVDAE